MYPRISPLLKFSLRMGIHSITNLRCVFGGVGKEGLQMPKEKLGGTTKMSFPQLLPKGMVSPKLR